MESPEYERGKWMQAGFGMSYIWIYLLCASPKGDKCKRQSIKFHKIK